MCMANALWAGLDRGGSGGTIEEADRYELQTDVPPREQEGAAERARRDRVVFGAKIEDANRYVLQIHIPAKEVARRSDMPCVVDGPVLRDLCNTLFTHPNMQIGRAS